MFTELKIYLQKKNNDKEGEGRICWKEFKIKT